MSSPEPPAEREPDSPPLGLLLQVPLAAFFGWVLWGLDEWTAVSLDGDVYPWMIAVSTGALALPWLGARRLEHAIVPAGWLGFLLLLPGLDNNALKPLLRTAYGLPVGLEREAILSRIRAAHEGTPYAQPVVHTDEPGRLLLKPQRDPGYAAESLIFTLEEGRLVRTWFSAD